MICFVTERWVIDFIVCNINDYFHMFRVPQTISTTATSMIVKMLQSEPRTRPKVEQLLNHEFFYSGFLPGSLPASCLTMAPRFDQMVERSANTRKPLLEVNNVVNSKFVIQHYVYIFRIEIINHVHFYVIHLIYHVMIVSQMSILCQ